MKLARGLVVALVTVAILWLLTALLGSIVYVANVSQSTFRIFENTGLSRTSITVSVFGAAILVCMFVVLLVIAVNDVITKREISSLFWPVLCFSAFAVPVFVVGYIGSLDLLIHDLMYKWNYTTEPEIRLINNVLLIGVFSSLGWFVANVLRGRGWGRLDVTTLLLGVVMFAIATVAVTLYISEV